MTPEEAYAALTDEQLDAMIQDPDMRGPGKKRLEKEKDRRSSS